MEQVNLLVDRARPVMDRLKLQLGLESRSEQWSRHVLEHFQHLSRKENYPILAAYVAVCFLMLFIIAWLSRSPAKSSRKGTPTTILVGPSDAGKTSIFINLVQGEHPQTHTSIQVSDTTFPLSSPDEIGSRQIRLIDLPGHPRLRDEVKKYIQDVDSVVFTVDIANVVRNAATVAEQIPPLLTLLASASAQSQSDPIRLLLLAHKSDLLLRPTPTSGPVNIPENTRFTAIDRLKNILTREMDRLKSARSSTSGKIEGMSKVPTGSTSLWSRVFGSSEVSSDEAGEEDAEGLIWGERAGGFQWQDIEGVNVEWGCSGLGPVQIRKASATAEKTEDKGDGLDEVRRFLWDS